MFEKAGIAVYREIAFPGICLSEQSSCPFYAFEDRGLARFILKDPHAEVYFIGVGIVPKSVG